MREKAKTINEVASFSTDKKVVYIAGKVTGLQYQFTYDKFMQRQMLLEAAGYHVINPMELVHQDAEWKQAMRICISFLPHADYIDLLPCWQDSEGAKWEAAIAHRLDIPVLKVTVS
ncbi:MAG: DUF4406 domain-containing protein [Mucilaginibacter sp.]|nr:DUF4406 domain-containing protein [Mucilaginibacter sp.]